MAARVEPAHDNVGLGIARECSIVLAKPDSTGSGRGVKNTLAAVQSVASQTLRGARSLAEFRRKFTPRLLALPRSHNLLAREVWQGADLGDVVAEALAPHEGEGARGGWR